MVFVSVCMIWVFVWLLCVLMWKVWFVLFFRCSVVCGLRVWMMFCSRLSLVSLLCVFCRNNMGMLVCVRCVVCLVFGLLVGCSGKLMKIRLCMFGMVVVVWVCEVMWLLKDLFFVSSGMVGSCLCVVVIVVCMVVWVVVGVLGCLEFCFMKGNWKCSVVMDWLNKVCDSVFMKVWFMFVFVL